MIILYSGALLADHTSLGIGVGVSSALNTESGATLPQGRVAFGARAQYVSFDAFSDQELTRLADEHVHVGDSLLNVPLSIFYGVTDNFTVGVRLLPYVRRANLREPGHANGNDHDHGGASEEVGDIEHLGDVSGIGDTILFGQYRFFNPSPMQHASVLFGVKAPTGRTDAKSRQGTRIEAEFQPGTGSWDGLAGLAYSYWFPPFAFDASLLYTYVTDGAQQTNLGDIFDYNFALSYRIGGGDPGVFYGEQPSYRWDLIAEFNGEWQDDVTVAGIKRPHGRNVVYFSPGIRMSGKKRWSAALSLGVPVVTRLNGPQAEPDYRVIGTVGFSF